MSAVDPVDQAIAHVEQQQPQITLRRYGPISLTTTGRPFFIDLPTDVKPLELQDIAQWLIGQSIKAMQAPPTPRGPAIAMLDGSMHPVEQTA